VKKEREKILTQMKKYEALMEKTNRKVCNGVFDCWLSERKRIVLLVMFCKFKIRKTRERVGYCFC
jgi:hypothetical protein